MHSAVTIRRPGLFLLGMGALIVSTRLTRAAEPAAAVPRPLVVTLDPATRDYERVLGGPPATCSMRSGYVVLGPGRSVGKHSTEDYEEVVVVFEGKGKMALTGGPDLALGPGTVAYCPPHSEHDVANTGSQPLRYLYVVAAVPSRPKE